MTDDELIALLSQKTPEELSLEEIELLRRRLAESDELRETLLGQLQMETYLSEALSRVELSPEKIVARANQQQPSSTGSTLLIALLIGLPLLALSAVVLVNVFGGRGGPLAEKPPEKAPPAVAIETPQPPVTPPAQGKTDEQPLPTPPVDGNPNPPTLPPTGPTTPWQAALEAPGDPPPFAQVAFQPYGPSFDVPGKDDLAPWIERVPGTNLRLGRVDTQFGRTGTFEGLGRLKCPWPADGVLRLQLENYNRLKLHFFHERVGVTLLYYEDQSFRWAAYATTREPGKPTPQTWALTATDDDRCRRSEVRFGGPLELRYREGELILSRGDIVLLSAPLAGPPTDVYLDGRATVQGIALVRASGGPFSLPERAVTHTVNRPADLVWTSTKPEVAQPQPQADGSLKFAADKAPERALCWTPLPKLGLQEVVFELADVSPGTGVFLARENGRTQTIVRFLRDRKSGQLAARLRGPEDDAGETDLEPVGDKSVGLTQPRCWVKLLYGCGNLRWWLSADGQHWGQSEMPGEMPPEIASLGLSVVANRPDVHITLRSIQLRKLAGLSALANNDLVDKAPALIAAKSPSMWLAEALRTRPAEVATGDWLRACTLRTLAAGAHRDLANPLLESLLDDASLRQLPVEQQLAALDDAMLMAWDLRDGQAMRVGILTRYAQLGVQAGDQFGLPAWTTVRQHFHAAPCHTWLQNPVDLDRTIRWELVQAAYDREPQHTLDFIRTLRFFQQHRNRGLVEWADSHARHDLPGQPSGEATARLKDSWREPLIEELSKETYNAMTELSAVLESQAWDDAARLVTSLDPEAAPGVAPFVNDKALLTSLPVAVQLTLGEYPQLRQALGDRFAALAKLRISQAIAAGDAATIELATVQFAGTEAAGEAHQWLGDRALAGGAFTRALLEYERAGQSDTSLAASISPRIRLAAAMLGRDSQVAATKPVQFGDVSMSAAEFEALVAEMRGRGGQSSSPAALSQAPLSVPKPSGFDAQVRSKLDGPTGDRPQEEVGRRTNQYRVPWADRQIATTVEEGTLYVANRFQVAAYNLSDGRRKWQSQNPPGAMARAQDWAMIPMRPLIAGDRIFVRLLYSANPLLVCLDKATGKLLWTAENREREFLVSDPQLVQGQLVALGILIQQEQQGQLRWCQFDPQSGELLRQRDLIRLRNTWGSRSCCEVAPLEGGLVAALGGITLAVDAAGNVRWVRTQVALPADEDPRWVLQAYQPPLVQGDRLFVAQPGVRSVECLSGASGRKHWSAVLPEVLGLGGLAGERLIVCTEGDVRALDAATGKSLWTYEARDLFGFPLVSEHAILISGKERVPRDNDKWRIRLTWIDPATGRPLGSTALPNFSENDPRQGPLVPYKDRLFTFFGKGQHDPVRDLIELTPKGQADPPPADFAITTWQERLPPDLLQTTSEILPNWLLVSAQGGDRTGRLDELHGERNVLGLRASADWPVVLARELPANTRGRLHLKFATESGQNWTLEIRLNDQLLKTHEIKDAKDRWQTLDLDLPPSSSSQPSWLTIDARSTNGDHAIWWKEAEVAK